MLRCLKIGVAVPCLSALLVISGSAFSAEQDRRLVNAAADQDWASLRTLLKQKFDVNSKGPDRSTALLWTAHWNDLEMSDLLLRAGANVNAANVEGVTPLS